ncbi:MAG: AcrR family transcriptional regulator, partial [Zhongshania aliphaticivorans]
MKKLPPEPRRRPSQSRSKVLVDAIIQACKQVLADEGEERLTTNRIAEVAGVTIGSLYQYFPNKEAIL